MQEIFGTIDEVKLVNAASMVLYYNLDTEKGMSGSPIYLKRENKYILIGVHDGYDNFEDRNCGTGIN